MADPLISTAEAPAIRADFARFFVHTYTRTSRVASGTEDAHGDAEQSETTTTGAPCKYVSEARVRVRNDEGGVTIVRAPTLTVAHDDPLDETDLVSNVQASDGTVLLSGPIQVGPPVHSAGFGPPLVKRFVLRGAEVTV
jgi:hypothetical protein